ncbi:DUF4215 domain-containing protein [Myxococcota bacterium]
MRHLGLRFWIVGMASVMGGAAGCGEKSASKRPAYETSERGGAASESPESTGPLEGSVVSSVDVDVNDSAGDADGENPCEGPNPPDTCRLVPSGPACGDGELNQEGEECDDGNPLPGDGCSGICRVEPNYACPSPGQACSFLASCGNGLIEPGEVCDDGNQAEDDGCNATCTIQSASFVCRVVGEPCEQIHFCGDGIVKGDENCDDSNLVVGDGCDSACHLELGWNCPIPGQACKPAPRCGDGVLNRDLGEACDDGNAQDGDGCVADCSSVQDGWICSPGQPCQSQIQCGDGLTHGGEQCDDANDSNPNDGCHECQLAPGYECPFPGAPCLARCGDGTQILNEECDDGNAVDGDGCASTCELESGWICEGTGVGSCRRTLCNDGTLEGTEGCEDGNNDLGDGCTPLCTIEPDCTAPDGHCTSVCGDGLVLGSEACDDGNALDWDGCSSICQVEPGYQCTQPPLGETMSVPVVYRDFRAGGDFEPGGAVGENAAVTGLVSGALDDEGKPVFVGSPGAGYITGARSFSLWYRDQAGVNSALASELVLYSNGAGSYVNRWGAEGERYEHPRPVTEQWCGTSDDCIGPDDQTNCTCTGRDGVDEVCGSQVFGFIECKVTEEDWGGAEPVTIWYTVTGPAAIDGNPLFFPLDGVADMVTATSEYGVALIPPNYGGNWTEEAAAADHNFHFTSEVRYWFQFSAGQSYTLDFTGDDDVWVFINKRLAVDLGGIHTPVSGTIILDGDGSGDVTITQSEPKGEPSQHDTVDLGLLDGQVYEIAVFQAERKREASTYKLTLSGFNVSKSKCGPICGDGVLSPGEQCDNGEGNSTEPGVYGQCNPDCTRGPYCGDGLPQAEGGEECDDGVNNIASGCAPGCKLPARCGDGVVNPESGEECDDGETLNTGEYGNGCNPDCTRGPYCGDGQLQAEWEQCDLGTNDGTYGNCNPDCTPAPGCGDGVLQADWGEECDDGNDVPGDSCSPNCRNEGVCGDSFVDPESEEECDNGVNDGTYGTCAPGCKLPPRCGDGVVQAEHEQCDDGINGGGYGECSAGCVLGPHCGDGLVQPSYEECDDADDDEGDLCSSACKRVIRKAG